MSDIITVREGSTEDIVFYLLRGGVAVNLGTDEVILRRRSGEGIEDAFKTTDVGPILSVTDATNGEVTLAPAAATWKGAAARWEYQIYFEAGPALGEHLVYPEGDNITIKVIPRFS
jgi:hypothetical protein